jgi:predicted amidohydrolase
VFSNVGFFRFVAGYDTPVPSLKTALEKHGRVGGSLIVLPEGFNIGKYYRNEGKCNHDRSVLNELRMVAATHNVTLVSGLIIKEPHCPTPPFSSVYIIDGVGCTLLCRKHGEDGYQNYTPFKAAPDASNPVHYGGASIAAIVCMDCDSPQVFRPIESELAKAQHPKIVCIPACMNKVYGDQAIAGSWPNHYVVLANSDPHGCNSFISKDGTIMERDNRGLENTIDLLSF